MLVVHHVSPPIWSGGPFIADSLLPGKPGLFTDNEAITVPIRKNRRISGT
jgi:hypothetical protein